MTALTDFVLSNLPPLPARVLEVGCGDGSLARAVHAAGYDVVAIDPLAPQGEIFRRIKLEELDEHERFDAVFASRSFHHMTNLDLALDRTHGMLEGGGPVVVDEFAWDLLDEPTADWYEGQRRILIAAGREPDGPATAEWEDHHAGLHGFDAMRRELDQRFVELHFSREPYLYRHLDGVASEELERGLIESGAINPLGFRFVGVPR